jgi:hypothetical protein
MAKHPEAQLIERKRLRRIADAAPELLDALRALLERVEASPEALNMARQQMDAARAAIARATTDAA